MRHQAIDIYLCEKKQLQNVSTNNLHKNKGKFTQYEEELGFGGEVIRESCTSQEDISKIVKMFWALHVWMGSIRSQAINIKLYEKNNCKIYPFWCFRICPACPRVVMCSRYNSYSSLCSPTPLTCGTSSSKPRPSTWTSCHFSRRTLESSCRYVNLFS